MPQATVEVCSALICRGHRILLVREEGSSYWTFCGGGQEPEETPEETILREMREELGSDIKLATPIRFVGRFYGNGREGCGIISLDIFKFRVMGDPDLRGQDEIAEFGWFSLAEALSLNLTEATRLVLQDKKVSSLI